MVATDEIRKRVKGAIREAREAAAARRVGIDEAERDGEAALHTILTPLFKTVAAALKAEGYSFRLLTPSGAVRLSSEGSADDFIEVSLDTARTPPALVGRTSRRWGRRVLVDESVVCEAPAIGALTDDEAFTWVLGQLAPFVER